MNDFCCDACMSTENVFETCSGHICAKCQAKAYEVQSQGQKYKLDAGKVCLSLVPASLERAVAQIRAVGVAKYGGEVDTWKKVEKERYFDALLRHVNAMRQDGINSLDQESGFLHLHHVACNVAFIIELLEQENVK